MEIEYLGINRPFHFYLCSLDSKFFEIDLDIRLNKTTIRTGTLEADGTEKKGNRSTVTKNHATSEEAKRYLNKAIKQKKEQGYYISPEMIKNEFTIKEDDNNMHVIMNDMDAILRKNGGEANTEGTLSVKTNKEEQLIVISDEEDTNDTTIQSSNNILENNIFQATKFSPIPKENQSWKEIEKFYRDTHGDYKTFYLTNKVEGNMEYLHVHIYQNNLLIEEGIEKIADFPPVHRKFKREKEAFSCMKEIILNKLALGYLVSKDKNWKATRKLLADDYMEEEIYCMRKC